MTTVCWDGKTLAADKQTTAGGTPYATTKIVKVRIKNKTLLVGACGSSADCQEFRHWVRGGFKGEPKFTDFTGMVIAEDGEISLYDENPNSESFNRKNWAIGSGANYALGAMAFGATAEEAVKVATDLDVYTGMGIDTLDFS